MDPAEIDDWFAALEARLELTAREREALATLRDNEDILEAMSDEFILAPDLEDWIMHDRQVLQRKLDEIVEMNLAWQKQYEQDWSPRLGMLREFEDAGIPVDDFKSFVTKILELARASHGTRFVTPNGRYFHRRECKWLEDIPESFLSETAHDDAVARGYKPCASCRA